LSFFTFKYSKLGDFIAHWNTHYSEAHFTAGPDIFIQKLTCQYTGLKGS